MYRMMCCSRFKGVPAFDKATESFFDMDFNIFFYLIIKDVFFIDIVNSF